MKIKQASLLADALKVKRTFGKSFARQVLEVMRLKKRNPTLGATDYFTYRLYDKQFLDGSPPENFLGWRSQAALAHALNLRPLVMPAWDKFSFAIIAHAFGLPVPRLHAVYMPGRAATSGVADVALNAPEALSHWLRTQRSWPLFAKPSYCQLGYGCHRFTSYRASDDSLVKQSGDAIPVEHFIDTVVRNPKTPFYLPEMGYLFQEALRSHPSIVELLGNETISGVRVVLLQDDDGIEVIGALWKLATGANDIDNSRGFSMGNLTGGINLATGRLGSVLNGYWPHAQVVKQSPQTHRTFEGFVIPHWQDVLALCTRAATVFPLLRIQHWDIAVTDAGPLILELNDEGALPFMQLWGRGLLTDRMRALLRDSAYGNTFTWLNQAAR